MCARVQGRANRSKVEREPVDRAEREVEDRVAPDEGKAPTADTPWLLGIPRGTWRLLDLEDDFGKTYGHGTAPGSVSSRELTGLGNPSQARSGSAFRLVALVYLTLIGSGHGGI